jgi:hypothetical protein
MDIKSWTERCEINANEIERLRAFAESCATNWDCDEEGHKYYGAHCRACDATVALSGKGGGVMEIRVAVKSAILGDSVFWEGPAERINEIRNIPARRTAEKVVQDGRPRTCGMWHVSINGKGE